MDVSRPEISLQSVNLSQDGTVKCVLKGMACHPFFYGKLLWKNFKVKLLGSRLILLEIIGRN